MQMVHSEHNGEICEHEKQPEDVTSREEFVYQLSDCQLLKTTLFHRIRYCSRLFVDDAENPRTRLSALFNRSKRTGNQATQGVAAGINRTWRERSFG